MTTLISHFYNEEYLLPWWLRHHRELFDHGILIDYASTDDSAEICRELVPNWEVRPSRNSFFDAIEVDAEVMDTERNITGWKIALNTTELLCGMPTSAGPVVRIPAVVMVDAAERTDMDASRPLVEQCTSGYFDTDHPSIASAVGPGRGRLLHRNPDGAYLPGRHATHHEVNAVAEDALVLWFGFAPWTSAFRARKLQIQDRMSAHDKALGYGIQHLSDQATLYATWRHLAKFATELTEDERYSPIVLPGKRAEPLGR